MPFWLKVGDHLLFLLPPSLPGPSLGSRGGEDPLGITKGFCLMGFVWMTGCIPVLRVQVVSRVPPISIGGGTLLSMLALHLIPHHL